MLEPNSALQKAENTLPFFDHDNQRKRNYLSFRICGFGRLEARKNAEVSAAIYNTWLAKDESFAEIESKGLLQLSRQFRSEVIGLEYTRNFKLCLDKDRIVLQKAVRGGKLTDDEWDYLKKIRPLYTPAALKSIEDLITGHKDKGKGLESWDEIVLFARRNGEYQAETTVYEYPAPSSLEELNEGSDGFEDQD